MKKYFTELIFIGLFFLLVCVFFYPTILQGKLPIPSDSLVGLYYPWRDYYAKDYPRGLPFKNFLITDPVRQQIPWRKLVIDQWKSGKLPAWNPYNFSGTPLAANIQAAVFYPFNILFLLLNFPAAWTVLIMLEPLLSGFFLYLYLRALRLSSQASTFGALAWSFSGFSIAWLTWGTIIHVSLWLPLILLALEKIVADKPTRTTWWLILLVVSSSLSVFAGHAQVSFYIFVVSFAYTLWKLSSRFTLRRVFLLGISLFLTLLITSVQWLPLIQFVVASGRVAEATNWLKSGWFLPWQHLVQFLAPDFFGNPTTLNYWGAWNYGEFIGYLGLVPLIFALFAVISRKDKRVLLWLVIMVVTLLFLLPTPIAKLPYAWQIPFVSTLQPTRLMVILDFSLVMLASFGISKWLTSKDKKIWYSLGVVAILVLALWGVAMYGKFVFHGEDLENNLLVSRRNLIFPTLVLTISVGLFGFSEIVRKSKIRYYILLGLLVLSVFDLFRFGWKFTPFSEQKYFFPVTETIKFLQAQPKPYRIMSVDKRILPPSSASFYGIESIEGYDPLVSQRYEELAAASERSGPDIRPPFGFDRIVTFNNLDSPLLPIFNARYVLSLTDLKKPYLKKVFQEGDTRIYENSRSLVRAFLVNRVITEINKDKIVKIMFDPAFDPAKTAVVEGSLEVAQIPVADSEYVKLSDYQENSLVLSAQTQLPRFLVIVNSFNACWKATVDQVPSKLYRTDYLFLGLAVPSGSHTIGLTCQAL